MVALPRPGWVLQLVIPPALLSYFAWAFKRCNGAVANDYLLVTLGRPWLSGIYRAAVCTFIPSITVIFLRLYFLPSKQCVPPHDPPPQIDNLETIFECVPPPSARAKGYALITSHDAEDANLIQRCTTCSNNWKPARTRHCSDCNICRAGLDHHCAFFANCLTAPYLPAFLSLVTIAPVAIAILISPMALPHLKRARDAWLASSTIPASAEWWDWKWSWVIPWGPLGRWVVGLSLAWRALDRESGGPGIDRFELGAMTAIGSVLGIVTMALAYTTIRQIRAGELGIDSQRSRTFARAVKEAAVLQRQGKEIGPDLKAKLERFAPSHWFFVPVQHDKYTGVVLPFARPYDAGPEANFRLMVSRGRTWWFLPWNAVRKGIDEEVWNWPVAPAARLALEAEAMRIVAEAEAENVDAL